MKLLLTSGGIRNPSIAAALVELLGKPIAECDALFIPTAIHPFPGGVGMAWQAMTGGAASPLCELGWKSLGLLELTALPSIRAESWVRAVREAGALLVWGGDALYLTHWMRESGLADLLSSLEKTVYAGVSAGSVAVTPYNCDAEFDRQFVPAGSGRGSEAERSLGLVDFTIYPHFDDEAMPDTARDSIARWAATVPVPTYAIDDETAIAVVDGHVRVVSEGRGERFGPAGAALDGE